MGIEPMTERGGRRPGSGRKKGTPNKANAARERAISESGLTPLDYLLSVMRNEDEETALRMDAAKAAAPFVHPKLSSIETKLDAELDGSLTVSRIELVAVEPSRSSDEVAM